MTDVKHLTVRELRELLDRCSPDELVLLDNNSDIEYPYSLCTAAHIVIRKRGDELLWDNGEDFGDTPEERAEYDAEHGVPTPAVHLYPIDTEDEPKTEEAPIRAVFGEEDESTAEAEGWGVFDDSTYGITIERIDCPEDRVTGKCLEPFFEADEDVWRHVAAQPEGSLGWRALEHVKHHNPTEYEKIVQYLRSKDE